MTGVQTCALPIYYVGSIGTSLDSEVKAGYDMVKKYIDIINERGAQN